MTMSKHLLKALMMIFLISVSGLVAEAQNPATEQKSTGSADGAVFIANPNPLYWNDTYLASQSQQTLTFFNAGDANLVITSGVFNGPFETYNSFPITVAPGSTFNQVIHFKPFQLGLIQGSVTYTSNDATNPTLQVSLIGTCINTPINGWEWLYTGFNFINMDIEFPEGQDQIGYIAGQNTTQNGLGIVLKTTNGGDNWTQVSAPGIFGLTNLAFPTLQTGYCVGWSNKVLKTTNGGTSWTEIVVAANIYYIHSIAFKDANNGVIVGVNNSGNAFAYATSNGGTSWTLGTGNQGNLEVAYAGGNTYYSTGYDYVSKSTNGGLNWTTVFSQGALLTGLYFYNESYGIAAGDEGQVITTWNGGQTWETDIIMDWLFHKPFIWDYDTAYVVGTPEYVYKTTDAGQNWNSDFNGNWQKAFYTIMFTDNYTGFISGSGGIICRKKPATVSAPLISASPNPVEFDVTFVGATAQQTLTIQNTGDAPLNVTNITSTNSVFSVNMTSFTVQPGQSQNITVNFAPTAAGYVQGALQIANNSATNPYPVAVNGTGMVPGPSPIFIANPNPLYFNDTYIASRSQQTLTFFNAGNANLVITSAIFSGPFETYNSFPITVAPGATFNQVIQFKPFQLGLIQGSVTYYSNDPINPILTVSLIGTCINTPINGWEWIYTGYNYILTDIEFPEGQNMIGYTGGQSVTYNGLGIMLKTTDGGDTWNPITPPGIAGIERFSFPTLQVGYAAGWSDQILKTTNGGQTWQTLNVLSNVFYYSAIEFKDVNNGIIIAKMDNDTKKTLYTSNGGATWTEATGNQAFEDITWAGGNTWYSTGYNNVCKSTNNGATWTTVYNQGALLLGADFLTPEFGIAAGDYGQVITTHNGGQTWEQDIILDILFQKPFIWDYDTAYVVGTPEYVYKTTNEGLNWNSDFDGNWQKAFYTITFTDNYTGFISSSGGIVCRKKPATVLAPVISATPNPLAFGNVTVGTTSNQTLSVQNTGNAPLQVTNITSTNPVFTANPTSFTVQPGGSQNVTVSFLPTAAGTVNANLQIANNSATNPYTVAVSGTGVATGPAPIIIVNPDPLYFDDTYIASRSQKTMTIFNAGNANLVLSSGVFQGPFLTYNTFPITIAPGTAYSQVIQFMPFELGLIEGSVTYNSNDPLNPSVTASLIGNCINTPINGWEWIYTGYNYILTDIEFPEGQNMIGYTGGQTLTYNGLGIMLKTTDGGDTWNPITQPGIAGIERFSFPTLQVGYAVGWSDQILKTTNGGQTWQTLNVVSNVFYYSAIEFKDVNNGIIIAKMNSGPQKTLYTSNGGATWTEGTGNQAFEDVTWAGGNTWYSTGYNNVCKSTNKGATWTTVYNQGALLLGADFLTPEFGIAAGDYGQVITTHNGGQTWEQDIILDILFHKPFIWDYDTAYVVGTPEYVYKTTNAGQNWISDFNGNWQKALYAVTFTNNYTGFVCGGSNGIVLRKKPGSTIPLAPPANLAATVNGSNVTLTWDVPSKRALIGYNVYRDNVKVNTTPVSATTYIDQNVSAGNHLYQVSAVYNEGESPRTGYVEVFVQGVTGKIQGFIRDAVTSYAISNAVITVSNMDNGTMSYNTPFGGHYSLLLPPGTYNLTCSSPGYASMTVNNLVVLPNMNKAYTFYLTPTDGQDLTTGMNDLANREISVYPNPANEVLHIDGLGLQKLVMMNYNGQVVYESNNLLNTNSINIGHLSKGIYVLKMETADGITVKKVVIE